MRETMGIVVSERDYGDLQRYLLSRENLGTAFGFQYRLVDVLEEEGGIKGYPSLLYVTLGLRCGEDEAAQVLRELNYRRPTKAERAHEESRRGGCMLTKAILEKSGLRGGNP